MSSIFNIKIKIIKILRFCEKKVIFQDRKVKMKRYASLSRRQDQFKVVCWYIVVYHLPHFDVCLYGIYCFPHIGEMAENNTLYGSLKYTAYSHGIDGSTTAWSYIRQLNEPYTPSLT